MKNALMIFAAVTMFAGFAQADQLCGKLAGYCGNGWCNKTITPSYCLGAILPGQHPDQGSQCQDGPSIKIVPESHSALDELNNLLDEGENTRICADGAKDDSGVFHVTSARRED